MSDIDKAVRAEIPDPVREPELHNVVMSCMIHGPFCNDLDRPEGKKLRCQQKTPGQCKDKFPFEPRPTTEVPADRFPLYRRRCQHTGRVKGHVISDEWVVSYNPWLLLKYRCHINVQIAANLKTFKYCYKYVFKKPDEAAVVIDEIENYLTGAQTAFICRTTVLKPKATPPLQAEFSVSARQCGVFWDCDCTTSIRPCNGWICTSLGNS